MQWRRRRSWSGSERGGGLETQRSAGPNTGNLVVSLEFADMAAYAAFTQKAQADSEWQAFQARVAGSPDPTTTLVGRSLITDLDL